MPSTDTPYSTLLGGAQLVLRSVRLYLAVGLAMLLGVGALIDTYDLLPVDPRGFRFAFAVALLTVLAGTYVAPRIAAYVREILLALAALMIVWLGALLTLNAFAPTIATAYFTMAFTGGALFGIAFRGIVAPAAYLGICIVVAAVAVSATESPGINPWLFLVCLTAVAVVTVVTAAIRERLTLSLEASRRLYAAAEAAGGTGSWVVDLASGDARWSDGMCDLLGTPRLGDAPAPSMETFVVTDDRPAARAAFEAVAAGVLDEHAVTVRVVAADGQARTLGGVVRAERDADGGVARVVGVATDVTARVAHQAELIEALDRAEAAARLKAAILANMSHEIRTPLTAVIGFAEMLADEADAGTQPLVEPILTGGQRLLDTLNSVLDLARLEADGAALEVWPVDLCRAAHAARGVYSETAALEGLTLTVDTPGTAVAALADAPALGRVLDNLLSNAIRFTDIGGVTLRVYATPEASILEVEDTGCGMPADFVPRAFDAFVQESDGDARTHEGSGLGLTIVQRLVEAMHGTVTIESAAGEGTRVRVELPAADTAGLATPRPVSAWVARRRLSALADA